MTRASIEYATPQTERRMRVLSIVAHVAAVLLAVVPWSFAIYFAMRVFGVVR